MCAICCQLLWNIPRGIEMVSVCTVPARGGRSCEHFGGYKTINRIPLPFIWECSLRAIQWVPIWQGLDGFQKSLQRTKVTSALEGLRGGARTNHLLQLFYMCWYCHSENFYCLSFNDCRNKLLSLSVLSFLLFVVFVCSHVVIGFVTTTVLYH